jgi:hypothetical protein
MKNLKFIFVLSILLGGLLLNKFLYPLPCVWRAALQ